MHFRAVTPTTLDTALLSMLGDQDVPDDQIEVILDEVLTCSLWTRRLRHRTDPVRQLLKFGLAARAKFIWGRTSDVQRRGYFLAGVGLETGEALDAAAPELNELLTQANGAILLADAEMAITSITRFAECVFGIAPFTPDTLPADWKAILRLWLEGKGLVRLAAGREDEVLKFVEQALVYKLPWAMEAVRVRGLAHNDTLEGDLSMEDIELGVAVSAVEAGSLNISAAMLMRAGFSSRLAAIHAVTETGAEFGSMSDLRTWLRSDDVASRRSDPDWPTSATHMLWVQFIEGLTPQQGRTWSVTEVDMDVKWKGHTPSSGAPLRLVHREGETLVCGADYQPMGELKTPLNPARRGVTLATVGWFDDIEVRYIGPGDLMRR